MLNKTGHRVEGAGRGGKVRAHWLGMALLFTLLAGLSTACVVGDDGCQEECYDRRVVVCDYFYCWEEYQTECYCADQGCRGDFQCRGDEYCGSDGYCYLLGNGPGGTTGSASLCQACVDHTDCAEQGALCLKLGAAESVCGRSCQDDSGCPAGYTCNDLQGQSGSQCVPASFTCQSAPSGCTQDSQCVSGQRCEAGQCVTQASACTQSTDCPTGQRCEAGACVANPPPPECSATQPCPSGEVCQRGQCVAAPACSDDSQCAAGFACVSGDCVEQTLACSATQPCATGFDCLEGACVAQTPECSDTLPCAVGYRCEASACVPNTGGACVSNGECSMGQLCVDGQCRAPECRVGTDCGQDMVCVNASCRPACSDTLPCPGGYLCRQGLGFCEVDPSAECQATSQCADGKVCDEGSCRVSCAASCQCPAGEVCSAGGGCVTASPEQLSCSTDCDCPSGQQCVNSLCVAP
jgi:hypothetical protein